MARPVPAVGGTADGSRTGGAGWRDPANGCAARHRPAGATDSGSSCDRRKPGCRPDARSSARHYEDERQLRAWRRALPLMRWSAPASQSHDNPIVTDSNRQGEPSCATNLLEQSFMGLISARHDLTSWAAMQQVDRSNVRTSHVGSVVLGWDAAGRPITRGK